MSGHGAVGSSVRAAAIAVAAAAGMVLGGCTYETEFDFREPAAPTSAPPSAAVPSDRHQSLKFPGLEPKAQLKHDSQELINAGASAVLLELRVGAEAWTYAAGARTTGGEAVRATDRIPAGDITQSLVAVSVLKLADEGRLSLDEPASSYLPELLSLFPHEEPYTVRDLLRHTSGMPDYYTVLLNSPELQQALATRRGPEDKLALAAALPWQRYPAQWASYSNSNYIALGLIVERLRWRPLSDVLRAEIWQPLNLTGTRLTDDGPAPDDMVHGYTLIDAEPADAAFAALHVGAADTGLVSTVGDLNTFFGALLDGRLVTRELVAEMQGPIHAKFGLGLYKWNDSCTNGFYVGHAGDIPGYGSVAMSSADGSRRIALAVAYAPAPLVYGTNMLDGRLTGIAEGALNASCRFGSGVTFGEEAAGPHE
jgi:D-alanyl-D-alanine carboxypeptidase